jgi:hypothetical protein
MALYRAGRVSGQPGRFGFPPSRRLVIIVLLLAAVFVPLWINSDRIDKITIRPTCGRRPSTGPTMRAGPRGRHRHR